MYEYRDLTPKQKAELIRHRQQKGYPLHSPPHPVRDRLFYLLTAACYEHKCHLNSESRRQQLLNLLFERLESSRVKLNGWVILPNHYHLLVKVSNFDLLAKVFQKVHGSTAQQWNREDNARGRTIWYYYSDRAIRSENHYYQALNYIHYNPVKHEWVKSPYHWLESSVHWYLGEQGREWLRNAWIKYPLQEYGHGWDDICKS